MLKDSQATKPVFMLLSCTWSCTWSEVSSQYEINRAPQHLGDCARTCRQEGACCGAFYRTSTSTSFGSCHTNDCRRACARTDSKTRKHAIARSERWRMSYGSKIQEIYGCRSTRERLPKQLLSWLRAVDFATCAYYFKEDHLHFNTVYREACA